MRSLFSLLRKRMLATLIGGGLIAATVVGAPMLASLFYDVDISFQRSKEIGDHILVRFPSWFSEGLARDALNIEPKTEGVAMWFEDTHELRFVPQNGFAPATVYRVSVVMENQFFSATLKKGGTRVKKLTFEPSAHISATGGAHRIFEPQYKEGKYLDLNIETMIGAMVENGAVIKTFPIAGKGNPWSTPTAEGVFTVLNKEENHWSNLYRVWLPWALNYYDGYFIHDIPYWPNGVRLTTRYSGGCIRLNTETAKEVYAWAEVGMPVVVHSTPDVTYLMPEENIADGDMVREVSDYRIWLVKHVNGKKLKRHVFTEQMGQWYIHLSPFWSKVKVVEDGTLLYHSSYRWVRLPGPDASGVWNVYEIDDAGTTHQMTCGDSKDCGEAWARYGWDPNEIYTIVQDELDYYPQGTPRELLPASSTEQ